MGMELVGPSKRIYAGILMHINFSIALIFVPESPRWLISKGKYKEAEEIIQKAARVNRVDIPKNIIDKNTIAFTKTVGLWQLFTSRPLISIPASAVPLLFLDKIGRRKFFCICMLISGLGGLLTLVPVLMDGPGIVTISTFKREIMNEIPPFLFHKGLLAFNDCIRNARKDWYSSCVSSYFYLFIGTLSYSSSQWGYGKLVRGKIMGGKIGLAFPLLVFGSLSMASAFLTLLLPETMGKTLPDTIQEGKRLHV
ncbi:hypothetical protein KUTeg_010356 [Tegillarca granosa]|uniref:Uncharacterized protein n=1 Tax=Tegillarca granosa TaxID=220873 RepID=A0ABQ9F6H5_TEGGR|nr:hypothetical protein KUTeg_010356 [Tegillarca granosa]